MQSKLAKPKPGTKSAFILAQPASLPAREVVARAKARGISTTVQSVQVCRSHARKRGLLPAVPTNSNASNGHAVNAKPKPARAYVVKKRVPTTADAALSRSAIGDMLTTRTPRTPFTDAERKLLELAVAVGVPRAVHLVMTLQSSYADAMTQVIGTMS
ncbi:MAG TPA: hypothetical protein VGO53_16560 [Steroidobacteraceae bacterium]|jgi:hypothetical protein|nr:hypothetical protein [Steroidobacteraceae bacterium]